MSLIDSAVILVVLAVFGAIAYGAFSVWLAAPERPPATPPD